MTPVKRDKTSRMARLFQYVQKVRLQFNLSDTVYILQNKRRNVHTHLRPMITLSYQFFYGDSEVRKSSKTNSEKKIFSKF